MKPLRDIHLERAVLGAAMTDPSRLPELSLILDSGAHFAVPEHQRAFAEMLEVYRAGVTLDYVTLKSRFVDDPRMHAVVNSFDPIAAPSAALDYAKQVRELAFHCQLRQLGQQLANAADSAEPASAIAARYVNELSSRLVGTDDAASVTARQLVQMVTAEIERRSSTRDHIRGLKTGIAKLDAFLQGVQRGMLLVLGAYTSAGKTALALFLMLRVLLAYKDLAGVFFALELSREVLGHRLFASESRVPLWKLRSGMVSDDEMRAVAEAALRLDDLGDRFIVSDRASTIDQIISESRALAAKKPLGIIVVDYLQLVAGRGGYSREVEVSGIGREFALLAKELNVAVIATAQLNEGAAIRPRPMLSDMRESRAINQHARTVLLLHRPWVIAQDQDDPAVRPCDTTVYIAKNSEGELGEIQLHFEAALQAFTESGCHIRCPYYRRQSDAASPDWQRERVS